MRRGVGVGAIKAQADQRAKIQAEANKLDERELANMTATLALFRQQLEAFAGKHKKAINADPVLRKRFHEMCSAIGVDPLSSQRGFWSDLLGVGDFYYELGVQIADVCIRTRHRNGGLLEINALRAYLALVRSKSAPAVSVDDIERAVGKLRVLGGGFTVRVLGQPPNELRVVQSVPLELNGDHAAALQLARDRGGRLTVAELAAAGWDRARSEQTLEFLEREGMAWIDDGGGQRAWYFPTLWKDGRASAT